MGKVGQVFRSMELFATRCWSKISHIENATVSKNA